MSAPLNVICQGNTSAKMRLLDRLTIKTGRRRCVEALAAQGLVSGNCELAEELADRAKALAVSAGQTLILQGADDNAIYFILAGIFDVVLNGRAGPAAAPENMSAKWRPCSLSRRSANGHCARRCDRCQALGRGLLESWYQAPAALSPQRAAQQRISPQKHGRFR